MQISSNTIRSLAGEYPNAEAEIWTGPREHSCGPGPAQAAPSTPTCSGLLHVLCNIKQFAGNGKFVIEVGDRGIGTAQLVGTGNNYAD
jgi:hypothetical protein